MALGKKILAIILLVVITGALFICSGIYNVSATNSHWPITRWRCIRCTSNLWGTADEIDVPESLNKDQQAYVRGANIYGGVCQMCHQGPGVKAAALYQAYARAAGLSGSCCTPYAGIPVSSDEAWHTYDRYARPR